VRAPVCPESPDRLTKALLTPQATAATLVPPPQTPPSSCCASVKFQDDCSSAQRVSFVLRKRQEGSVREGS
jgi:hypothetical protein